MSSIESPGRRTAVKSAAARWGLPPEFTPIQAQQEFLKRIGTATFDYDDRLIAELHLLARNGVSMRMEGRLLAQGEGDVLRAYASKWVPESANFQARATKLSLANESLLSRSWHQEWLQPIGSHSDWRSLEFQKPPSQRRPLEDAVKALRSTEDLDPSKPQSFARKAFAVELEEELLITRVWSAFLKVMRIAAGLVALAIMIDVSIARTKRSDQRNRKLELLQKRTEELRAKKSRWSSGERLPWDPASVPDLKSK